MDGHTQRLPFAFVLLMVLSSTPVFASWEAYDNFWKEFAKQPDAKELWKTHMLHYKMQTKPQPELFSFDFDCDTSTSGEVPTSVHSLRPGDINVVGAIGDSLTAANGADANGIVRVLNEYRGLSWSIGGKDDLAAGVTTLPNILRNYNSELLGMSTRTGKVNSRYAGFNAAVPGAKAVDMPAQARDLVSKMKASRDVDMTYDWKMVTLFIGGNDLCNYCGQEEKYSAYQYSLHIREALDILHAELPRTFVNLAAMIDVGPVANIDGGPICTAVHVAICNCARKDKNSELLKNVVGDYNKALEDLVATGRYETREDFTVVYQPFAQYMELATLEDGSADLSFFAPDCFHFSQKAHGEVAVMLWNGMMQPVGQKSRNIGHNPTLQCPLAGAYIPTALNSGGK